MTDIRKKLLEKYDAVGYFQGGRALIKKDGKCGHVNENGNVTTQIIYDAVGDFYEGRAPVKKDGEEFYVDLDGNEIKECE